MEIVIHEEEAKRFSDVKLGQMFKTDSGDLYVRIANCKDSDGDRVNAAVVGGVIGLCNDGLHCFLDTLSVRIVKKLEVSI